MLVSPEIEVHVFAVLRHFALYYRVVAGADDDEGHKNLGCHHEVNGTPTRKIARCK